MKRSLLHLSEDLDFDVNKPCFEKWAWIIKHILERGEAG